MGLLQDIVHAISGGHPAATMNDHADPVGTSNGALPPAVVAGQRPNGSFGPMPYGHPTPAPFLRHQMPQFTPSQAGQFNPGTAPLQAYPQYGRNLAVQGAYQPGGAPLQASGRMAPMQGGYDQTIQF